MSNRDDQRRLHGPNLIDMLLKPVDGGLQDAPQLDEDLWYPTEGLIGPDNPLDSDPEKEGPPGSAVK